MLSIARLEAGAGGDDRDSLDLSALVSDVAELYEPVAEERGIALKADMAGFIPVRGNRQLLGQAIANLIDNAIEVWGRARQPKAMAMRRKSCVRTSRRDGFAEITVTDRGPGVPASERERVLDRFVRLEASRSEPGSGLGLSLVAAVARLHGGDAEA